jgi:hypothetical protein
VTSIRAFATYVLILITITTATAQERKEEPKLKANLSRTDELPGGLDDHNPLAWKFAKDAPFYQDMTTKTIHQIKGTGVEVEHNQVQTFLFKFEPIKLDGDKWIVKQTIEGVKMSIDIGGSPMSYDTANDTMGGGGNPALAEFLKALKGTQFMLTFAKDGTVEKVGGRTEFLKKIKGINCQLEPLIKKTLSEDSLKVIADPSMGMTPKEIMNVGEKWHKTTKMSLGFLGTYENTCTFIYAKQTGDVADIDVSVALKYRPPVQSQGGEKSPFKIKGCWIEETVDISKYNKGKVTFNTKTGRIEVSEILMKMTGNLTIDINGTTSEVKLIQEQTTIVKTSTKSFVTSKK